MAYRKRGYKNKRSQRPRVARRRMMRKVVKSSQYLKIKETFDAGTFGATSGQALGFALNNLPQLASYQNLYQKYKITGALLKFIPVNVSNGDYNQALSNATGTAPWMGRTRIAYSIQRGNMATPGSELAILQQNHKIRLMGDNIISVYVKSPVFGVDANPGGVTTESKWTTGYLGTIQSADVVHQGIEWYASVTGSSSASFKVIVTLYVTFTEPN